MILRKSLPILLSAAPVATAYFAQVNNAHLELLASSSAANSATSSVETVDDRPSLQHASSVWTALEEALEAKSELGYAAPRIMELFEEWAGRFERAYENAEERSRRMLVWLENHVLIETHNAREGTTFTLGHNEFSDMSHDEFQERMKLGPYSPGLVHREDKTFNFMEFDDEKEEDVSNARLRGAESVTSEQRALEDTEDAEDWHGKGLMGPVRNQGTCGACWAFSAVGAIESAMAIDKYGKMTPSEQTKLVANKSGQDGVGLQADLGLVIPLSEQNLIDCDTQLEQGCKGGLMTTTFDEEEVKKGICSEVDYPYIQTEGTCSSDLCTPVPDTIVKDHVDIQPRKSKALEQALKVQPVTAAMVATDPMFQFYKGGIYQADGCGSVTKQMGDAECNVIYAGQDVCLPDINHGVLVVGYGRDDQATGDLKTYFKVKNSWGPKWGEDGYFRLARYETDKTDPLDNWGECAILSLLSFPIME